jgi:hypothetical protein
VNSYNTKKLLQEFGFSSTKQAKKELETKRISQALDILKNQHNYNIYVKSLVSVEKNKNKIKKIKQEKRFKNKHNKILNNFFKHKNKKQKFMLEITQATYHKPHNKEDCNFGDKLVGNFVEKKVWYPCGEDNNGKKTWDNVDWLYNKKLIYYEIITTKIFNEPLHTIPTILQDYNYNDSGKAQNT